MLRGAERDIAAQAWVSERWAGDTRLPAPRERKKMHIGHAAAFQQRRRKRRQVMPRTGAQHRLCGYLARAGWGGFLGSASSVQACLAAPAQFSFQLSFGVRGKA